MGALPKDQKIIWALCGGVCCYCKIYCIEQAKTTSGHLLIGEVAHIKGENEKASRYDASMTDEARNSAPNLMLLCANCHTMVDKDEVKFSVEVLEDLKRKNVDSIAASVKAAQSLSEAGRKVYCNLVDYIDKTCQLERWEQQSSCMLRFLLNEWMCDALGDVYRKTIQFSFPGDIPDLEEKIKHLSECAFAYTNHFLSNAELQHQCFRIKGKSGWLPDNEYSKYVKRSEKWRRISHLLLYNLSLALRDFAHSVRKNLDPHYRPENRDFWLNDDMGVIIVGNDLEGALEGKFLIPSGYHQIAASDLEL